MNAHLPKAAEDAYSPTAHPAWGVVSRFDFGHLIALWAERPVVASPFGQAQVHQQGNARASAVLAARTDDEAYQQARRTGARYILASPFGPILGYEDAPREETWAHRLLDGGGLDTAHFRLLHDSKEQRARPGGGTFARVVEVVEGAVIEGRTGAGSSVRLELTLRDNNGQRLQYVRAARADDGGRFRIRVAHPTDVRRADTVSAEGPYVLYRDGRPDTVEVSEAQVQTGATVVVPEPSLGAKAEGTAPCPGCRPLEFDAAMRGD
jgi:dolichyl-diphosphooligosaccharide--protein glycosyltransferase